MMKLFLYCFDKWWRPILFFGLTIGLLVLSEIIKNRTFGNICLGLFGIGLITLIVSTIFQLYKRRWIKSILTFFLLTGTIFSFIYIAVALFWIEQETPDGFADKLQIPTNIKIENPIDLSVTEKRPDSLIKHNPNQTDFQLYNSFQPGLYEYDLWTGKIGNGIIFLKAYEITNNFALSAEELPKSSSVRIYNSTDSIIKFGTINHFTIYEGDWGKPYAARFEVWFKPDDGGKEQKLIEKNYKIEGWQR